MDNLTQPNRPDLIATVEVTEDLELGLVPAWSYSALKTFESYADCIVLRHPQNDFIIKMSKLIKIPIINAGNGDGEHPTQALLDLFTINNYYNLFENDSTINIILIGDVPVGSSLIV